MPAIEVRDAVVKILSENFDIPVDGRKQPYARQGEELPRIMVSCVGEREDNAFEGGFNRTYTIVAIYALKTQGQIKNPEDVDEIRVKIRQLMRTFLLVPNQRDYKVLDRPPIDLAALASYYDSVDVAVDYEVYEVI
jgi:hypothetical protein